MQSIEEKIEEDFAEDSEQAIALYKKYDPLAYYEDSFFLLKKKDALRLIDEASDIFLGYAGVDFEQGGPCERLAYIFGICDTPTQRDYGSLGEGYDSEKLGKRYEACFYSAADERAGAIAMAKAIIEDAPEGMQFGITLE